MKYYYLLIVGLLGLTQIANGQNTSPIFTSSPVTSVLVGEPYAYPITTSDADGHHVSLTSLTKPDWLSLTLTGFQVSTFAGTGSGGSTDGSRLSASFDDPTGIALDASGNAYVVDLGNHKIRKIDTDGNVTTFAGTGSSGSSDANGTSASFNSPFGVAVDASDNLYVTEFGNHNIRKIAPNGDVTTLAGTGSAGSVDANGTSASFNFPFGIAVDAAGNVYVADASNHKIRKIASNGDVTTLAGSGSSGSVDANGTSASFNSPVGVAVDGSGNVYVADRSNHSIRKIAPNGDVTTLAGTGSQGSDDGTGLSASFRFPRSLALDGSGNVYVTDETNHKIRKIDVTGDVTTIAGTGSFGSDDGPALSASFAGPSGITLDAFDNLVITDRSNDKIRKISGTIGLIGDAPTTSGSHLVELEANDGNGGIVQQQFTLTVTNTPPTFTSSPVTSVFSGESYSYPITANDTDGHLVSFSVTTQPDWLSLNLTDIQVSTFAGSGSSGSVDDNGASASFNGPKGVAIDGLGNVYVADQINHKIRKITPSGDVTTLAGTGSQGAVDDNGILASFRFPSGLALDGSGNLYVADQNNHKIRKITPNGDVTTLAGTGSTGSVDANGTSASFSFPGGVAVDALGNVYVSDVSNNKIRKIAPNGDVTTLAGTGSAGSTDANGTSASFDGPQKVAVDALGNVYVADRSNHKIRRIAPNGDVTTLAGSGSSGSVDANGTSASFFNPLGVAVDPSGNVYVTEQSTHKIRKIDYNGDVTTISGTGSTGSLDGDGSIASFNNPQSIALDGSGNLYVADQANNKIRKITSTIELSGEAPATSGSHDVVVEANDGNGGIVEQSFTVLVTIAEITWNGTVWSNGTGPSDTEKAIIAGDYTGGLECAELEVLAFNDMTVPSGATLEVSGNLTVNGDLIIESGGSLISYASALYAGGVTTIKRNTRYVDGKYSFVGTPVEQIASITEATLGSNVYYYDETESYSTNDGLDRWDIMTGELVPGTGYTQANQHTIIFNGEPNTGTITYTGTYTEDTDDANEGWNLVANPYAAAINTAAFLTVNNHISGAVYIWDDNGSDQQRGTNSDYLVANETMATSPKVVPDTDTDRYNNHLGSTQAFFVKFDDGTNTDIVFTEGMRTVDNNADGNFFRQTELPITRINLTNSEGLFKQTVVGFADDAREDKLNRTYDAQAFNAASEDGLFTIKAGRSLTLNGMTSNWETIQLQHNVKEAGQYTISVELEGYDQALYLSDNLTGEVIDMRNQSYSFTAEAGINTDRFELISGTSEVLGLEEETILIYANERILYIRPFDNENREFQLFNMQGRKLMSIEANGNKEVNLQPFHSGVYLVFDGQKTHKIILD